MTTVTMPGSFADVTAHNGSLYVCTMQGDVVVAELQGGALVERWRFPCGGNGFARIRSVNGVLWLIYRPQSGTEVVMQNLTTGESHTHTGVFYNWPACLGVSGYAVNFGGAAGPTVIYDYPTHWPVTTLNSGTPTGLARVADDNLSVVTIDDNRGSQAQWGLLNPEYAGDVFCGEGMTGGVPMVYQHRDKLILREGTECFVPKITQHGSAWAVVTTDYRTVQLTYDITAADFGAVTVPPIEPPVEPPPTTGRIIYIDGALYPGDIIKVR